MIYEASADDWTYWLDRLASIAIKLSRGGFLHFCCAVLDLKASEAGYRRESAPTLNLLQMPFLVASSVMSLMIFWSV